MPFSQKIREDAIVKSDRHCCVCHKHKGVKLNVHHIIQECEGGENILENAIVLCLDCHSDAGHYNPKHPIGLKYSPSELKRHRDKWWAYCKNYDEKLKPDDYQPPFDLEGFSTVKKEIGTLWSNWANYSVEKKIIKFEGKFLVKTGESDANGYVSYELYQIKNGKYLVYIESNHNCDWGQAYIAGVDRYDEADSPLTLSRLQEEFPIVATAAGLIPIETLKF